MVKIVSLDRLLVLAPMEESESEQHHLLSFLKDILCNRLLLTLIIQTHNISSHL